MILIVAWHFATQFAPDGSGVLDTKFSAYHLFAIAIGSWGQLGVDLFIIVSVFFLKDSNRFRSAKVIELIAETILYGIFWVIICYLMKMNLSVTETIKSIFSLFFGTYWFATAYLLVYFFSPLLNNLIKKCSKELLKRIVIFLTIFVCIYKTLYHSAPVCDFLFFVYIYVLLYYIENTRFKDLFEKNCFKGFCVVTMFIAAVNVILVLLGTITENTVILKHSYYLNLRGSAFVLLDALFVFYCFRRIPEFKSRFVNLIAGTCFGIFLCHQGLAYNFWFNLFYERTLTSLGACLHMVVAVVCIFAGCCLLDLFRQATFGFLLKKILNISYVADRLTQFDLTINKTF